MIVKVNNVRTYNLPVGAHLMVDDSEKVEAGKILVKIPRKSAKSGDITGGLTKSYRACLKQETHRILLL
jgi:DNA-directed RNA polymerase subunit beta'